MAVGVAHDFSNMLQIINGYSELVIDELAAQIPAQPRAGHQECG